MIWIARICACVFLVCISSIGTVVFAQISWTGNVTPTPNTWNSSTLSEVGQTANGSVTVTSGTLLSQTTIVGSSSGVDGSVLVDGANSRWTLTPSSGSLTVGRSGGGSLQILNGGLVEGVSNTIGQFAGSSGSVVVSEANSRWLNSSQIQVGVAGRGSLGVHYGGQVTSKGARVALNTGSVGNIVVNGTNSRWTIDRTSNFDVTGLSFGSGLGSIALSEGGSIVSRGYDYVGGGVNGQSSVQISGPSSWTTERAFRVGAGNGNIGRVTVTGGGTLSTITGLSASDDFRIGSTAGSHGIVELKHAGTNWTNHGVLHVGYSGGQGAVGGGQGTLTMTRGATASSRTTYVGYNAGSAGSVSLSNSGTSLAIVGASANSYTDLIVGHAGSGSLSITSGSLVRNQNGTLGSATGSTGYAEVKGVGSLWENRNYLTVGNNGHGTLVVSGGGIVTAANTSVGANGLLSIEVGNGSQLDTRGSGTGLFANSGLVRLTAAWNAAAGTYTPIMAGTWQSNNGTIETFGGTWDSSNHTFTIAAAQVINSGGTVNDNNGLQRVNVTDPSNLMTTAVTANFAVNGAPTSFQATQIATGSNEYQNLQILAGNSILSAWNFNASGGTYNGTNAVNLTFAVGSGFTTDQFRVWHFKNNQWEWITPDSINYDGTNVSFNVNGFSGYALSAVPEPSSLLLVSSVVAATLASRRWRREPKM